MKVVLFCGEQGTRIRDYPENIPKPMVPIGHHPISWHVMQYYSQHGHRDFILCVGYKANFIKEYFLKYKQTANSDCIISNFGNFILPNLTTGTRCSDSVRVTNRRCGSMVVILFFATRFLTISEMERS
jgi:hypothetical protein